jgi:hypothetical protein
MNLDRIIETMALDHNDFGNNYFETLLPFISLLHFLFLSSKIGPWLLPKQLADVI